MISRSSAEQEFRQEHALSAREAGGRLVEHQQLRVRSERHRDRDLPVLAVREGADELAELGVDRRAVPAAARARSRISPSRFLSGPAAGGRPRRRGSRGRCCPRQSVRGRAATAGRCGRGRAWHDFAPASSSRHGRRAGSRPLVGGKSPEITLNSVVLPAPFGPRIARRSPGVDLEIDVANGVQAAEAPADPPQAEGRLGALGVLRFRCCARHLLLDDAVHDGLLVAAPRKRALHAGRLRAARRGLLRPERAAERLVHVRGCTGRS